MVVQMRRVSAVFPSTSMKIGDAGLQRLTALQSLQSINLNSSSVTDEGMKSLAQLRKLKNIYMPYTKVTDAGIWELRALPDLEGLTTGSNVTIGGATRLHEHLPNCAICGCSAVGGQTFVLPSAR